MGEIIYYSDNKIYNEKGHEICGWLNKHGKICKRIGKCPFHAKIMEKKESSEIIQELRKNLEPRFKLVETKEKVKKQKLKKSWTKFEHLQFLEGLQKHGRGNWKQIAQYIGTRSTTQVHSHSQKYFMRKSLAERKKKTILDFSIEELRAEVGYRTSGNVQEKEAIVMMPPRLIGEVRQTQPQAQMSSNLGNQGSLHSQPSRGRTLAYFYPYNFVPQQNSGLCYQYPQQPPQLIHQQQSQGQSQVGDSGGHQYVGPNMYVVPPPGITVHPMMGKGMKILSPNTNGSSGSPMEDNRFIQQQPCSATSKQHERERMTRLGSREENECKSSQQGQQEHQKGREIEEMKLVDDEDEEEQEEEHERDEKAKAKDDSSSSMQSGHFFHQEKNGDSGIDFNDPILVNFMNIHHQNHSLGQDDDRSESDNMDQGHEQDVDEDDDSKISGKKRLRDENDDDDDLSFDFDDYSNNPSKRLKLN